MCMPIEPQFDVQLSDEELRQIQEAAAAANGATPASTDPKAPEPNPPTITADPNDPDPGNKGAPGKDPNKPNVNYGTSNGGLTDAEMLNQQLLTQISDLQGNQNLLDQQITNQAAGFQSVAQGILQSQQMAADALRAGFTDLTASQEKALKAADELRKNTGQASRKPNYSLKLKENAAANRGGISSTMLTGTGGVATNALTLGRPALLGG